MMYSADGADRDVDEEDPVPADVVGQEATERRADESEMPNTAPNRPWYLPRSARRASMKNGPCPARACSTTSAHHIAHGQYIHAIHALSLDAIGAGRLCHVRIECNGPFSRVPIP